MVLKDFIEHEHVEKYDLERRTSQLRAGIKFGYETSVICFGWTNAAFTELYAEMSERGKEDVLKVDGLPKPARH